MNENGLFLFSVNHIPRAFGFFLIQPLTEWKRDIWSWERSNEFLFNYFLQLYLFTITMLFNSRTKCLIMKEWLTKWKKTEWPIYNVSFWDSPVWLIQQKKKNSLPIISNEYRKCVSNKTNALQDTLAAHKRKR